MAWIRGRAYQLAVWAHRRLQRALKAATVGVRLIVADGDGRVLLVRHSYRPGWFLPGGGVEPGETPLAAVLREAREEAGVAALSEPRLLGAYHLSIMGADDYPLVYVLERYRLEPCASPEIAEIGWFAPDALPEGVSGGTRRRIDEWLGRAAVRADW